MATPYKFTDWSHHTMLMSNGLYSLMTMKVLIYYNHTILWLRSLILNLERPICKAKLPCPNLTWIIIALIPNMPVTMMLVMFAYPTTK